MLWLLALHIMTFLFWLAALLYIPALVAANKTDYLNPPEGRGSMARFIYTAIASPAALFAIAAGTAIFMVRDITDFWLMGKLLLVAGLVILHGLTGLFLLRMDRFNEKAVRRICALLAGSAILLIVAIIVIVLSKPQWDFPL